MENKTFCGEGLRHKKSQVQLSFLSTIILQWGSKKIINMEVINNAV